MPLINCEVSLDMPLINCNVGALIAGLDRLSQ